MRPDMYPIHAAVEDRHWWWRARRDILRDTIRAHAPSRPLRLVEVGCGTGGNLSMLAEFGRVLGAEADTSAVEALRSKYGDRYPSMVHRIPEPLPGCFDVLCMFDVLEHIEAERPALEWAAQQLLPGGILVLTVPALDLLWTEQDEAAQHFRRYTHGSLRDALPPPFEIMHLTYFNTLLFPVIAGVRTVMNAIPRGDREPRDHLGVPPRLVNEVCYRLFRLERHLAPVHQLPIGVSLLLVARRY